MTTIKKTIKKATEAVKQKTIKTVTKSFTVVNGNGTVQGTFKTLTDAKKFAQETGFKVQE